VFPGSFDLDAAIAVTAVEPLAADDILGVLDALLAKSIVTRERGSGAARFSLLESLREYGLDLLRQSAEENALRLRHCAWVADFATRAESLVGAEQAAWLDTVEREQEHLRAALDFCLNEPDAATTGLRIAAQCWLHWIARGHLGEARRWLTSLLEKAPPESTDRARALVTLAMVALSGADVRRAVEAVDEARPLAQETGDVRTAAYCDVWGGVAAYMQHDFARSESLLTSAAAEFASIGDDAGLAHCQTHLGALAGARGDLDAASEWLDQALGLAHRRDDGWLLARATLTHGSLLAHWGHGARAAGHLQASLRASRAIRDTWAIAVAIELLALVAIGERRLERAARLLGVAEALWEAAPPAFTPEWAASRERTRAAARDGLGEPAFTKAVSGGRALTLDAAIRLALEQPEPERAPQSAPRSASALSARELEVASLVATGMSNKEIAARLIIAERTVDSHVNHILTRLGFSSRVQLAAWHTERARSVSDT
jgi:non-specific serine/threonine protein kinase